MIIDPVKPTHPPSINDFTFHLFFFHLFFFIRQHRKCSVIIEITGTIIFQNMSLGNRQSLGFVSDKPLNFYVGWCHTKITKPNNKLHMRGSEPNQQKKPFGVFKSPNKTAGLQPKSLHLTFTIPRSIFFLFVASRSVLPSHSHTLMI